MRSAARAPHRAKSRPLARHRCGTPKTPAGAFILRHPVRSLRQNGLMPTHPALRILALALLLVCYPRSGNSEARLPGMLSSHMVLQRERPIHLWGWSAPGEKVSVTLHGIGRSTAGDNLGHWGVFLPPEAAGGPYQLSVTAGNQIVLDDVLIGDVWFASGQSNMEMPLKGWGNAPLKDSAAEIAHATQPQMRLLHIPHRSEEFPLWNSDT